MTRRSNKHLLALNGVLVVALALVTFAPGAEGRQTAARSRAPGQYAMVSARIQGASDDAIFIVDSANEEMIAIRWDRSRRAIDGVGYRDLAADAELATRRQGR